MLKNGCKLTLKF